MMRLRQTLLQCVVILTVNLLMVPAMLATNPKEINFNPEKKGFLQKKKDLFHSQLKQLLKKNMHSSSPFRNDHSESTWAIFDCANGILGNPEFESDFTSWDFHNNSSIVADSYTGNNAAQASGSSSGGVGQNLPAYEGQVYSLAVYAKKNTSAEVSVGIKFYDAAWNTIGAEYVAVNSTIYEPYRFSAKAPKGTAYVQAMGWKNAGSGTANFDAFCFELWDIQIPVCSGVKCEISPSWGNYVWAMDDGSGWKDYDDGGLYLCDNGDGTLSILGNIINGHDSDWDSGTGVPCGAQDGWEINLHLFDRQTWAVFQGNYVQNNGCGENRYDWDFWDINGTLTGTGCNAGRTIDILSPAMGYRTQIGWGGNSQSCDFGISNWMHATENGNPVSADLYAHLNAACYDDTRPEDCSDGVDNDNDGLADCYDGDCGIQVLANQSFEDVTGINFNDTFEGNPAAALANGATLLPNWSMEYGCGGNCFDSYWIDDSADLVNNPKGDYFLWLPGSSYCAGQDIVVDMNKCYEITLVVAAWSVPSPQLKTNMVIEAFGGGIDDGNGGVLKVFEAELPASPNWQHLNWQTIKYTWSPQVSTSTRLYISQYNNTTTARGLVVDQILVKEICCGGGMTPEISCADGRDVELNFVGLNNDVPKTLNLADVSNMDSVVVEVVYKGGNPGSTIDVEDDGGNTYSAARQSVGSGAYVYRVALPPTSSVLYANTSNASAAQSLSAFVFRNNQPGKTVVTEFTTIGGYSNTYTLDFGIPKDVKTRNIKLTLPISEITYDNRSLDFVATAGSVSVSKSRTWGSGNHGFPNGCCIDTVEFLLENVAPDVDLVSVDVISPGGGSGQSFVIAATIAVEIFCEEICGNGIDDDGDGYVDNEDQDCLCPQITSSQSGDTTICEAQPITFEVHSDAPNPPYGYIEFYRFDSPQANPYTSTDAKVWLGLFSNVNNGSGSITSDNFPNTTASEKIYYVYACLKPEPQDVETCAPYMEYIVRVKNAPSANAGSDATICGGTDFSLSGNASGGGGPFTFSWDNGLGAGANHTVSPNNQTTYTLTVSGGNGCSDTDAITVDVNASPTVDAGNDASICLTDATTLVATGAGAVAPATYQWSNGLGTGDTKVVQPNTTTNYSVTLTSGNGCNAIDDVTVTVGNCVEDCSDGIDNDGDGLIDCADDDCIPDAYAGMDVSICIGSSTTLEASVTSGAGSYTYQWSGGLGAGAVQTVAPAISTAFTVTVTNSAGCEGLAFVTVTVNNCPEDCTDGIDNDGDGLVDCDDPDCLLTASPQLVDDEFTTCPALPLTDRVTYNDANFQDPVFAIASYPSQGSVSIDGTGKFTYTPITTTCGTDVFFYEVCNQVSGCCAQAMVTITIGDPDPPVLFNLPPDITISCDETIPDPTQVLAFDECPGIFIDFEEETQEFSSGACESYTITRTWTAQDLCGNTSSGQQIITVEDLEAPELFRVYTLANGKRLLAGVSQRASNHWKYVKFPVTFGEIPLVLSQTISENEISAVQVQQRYISTQGFEMRLREQEAFDQIHAPEQVAWLAIEPGALPSMMEAASFANANDIMQTLAFGQTYTVPPYFLAQPNTANETDPATIRWENATSGTVDFFLQEETSKDGETTHGNETLAYLAFEPGSPLVDENGFAWGESGQLSLTNAWATVNLSQEYVKPVVIFGGVSGTDGEPTTVRVRNVSATDFEVRLKEWDGQDGTHSSETVSYLVVEGSIPANPGEYCNPDGLPFQLGDQVFFRDNCDDQVFVQFDETADLVPDGLKYTRSWTAEDDCGNPAFYNREDNCTIAALRVRSLLYGALVGNGGTDLMRDNLRSRGFLPASEPYTALPAFDHQGKGGGESVLSSRLDVTGDDAVVDWVFLEVRSQEQPDEVLATTSVLLQRDGDIENIDGGDVVYFPNLLEGPYFVSIRHRNHIGLMTEKSWYLSSVNIPTVDFSSLTVDVKGNINAGPIYNGKRAMWPGDYNNDRRVIYQGPNNDIFSLFSEVLGDPTNSDFLANYIKAGYNLNDLNLDGNTIFQGPSNDKAPVLYHSVLFHPGNPSLLANYIVSEYLP